MKKKKATNNITGPVIMEKSYKVSELAEMVNGVVKGNPDAEITGVNSLKLATAAEASFLSNIKYRSQMDAGKAGVILVVSDWKFEPKDSHSLPESGQGIHENLQCFCAGADSIYAGNPSVRSRSLLCENRGGCLYRTDRRH